MPRNVIPFGVYDIHARADNRHIEHDGQDGWFASVSIWKGGEIPLTTCKFAQAFDTEDSALDYAVRAAKVWIDSKK